jgi:hypothetical protein
MSSISPNALTSLKFFTFDCIAPSSPIASPETGHGGPRYFLGGEVYYLVDSKAPSRENGRFVRSKFSLLGLDVRHR